MILASTEGQIETESGSVVPPTMIPLIPIADKGHILHKEYVVYYTVYMGVYTAWYDLVCSCYIV